MKLRDLAGILPVEGTASADLEVTGISSDSRQVKPGVVFFALAGTKADGAVYAVDAAARGAAAIVAGKGSTVAGLPVPVLAVDDPRLALALSAARYFGKQPETMVAVTGTSGKTSVAAFTRQIWEQAGYAAASIGTTGVVAPGRNDYGSLTTPDPVALHQLLRELADAGVTHASMEASSHGLDQRRLDGVKLAAGGFTNLGRDHMDYHATIEDYHRAKLRLFDALVSAGLAISTGTPVAKALVALEKLKGAPGRLDLVGTSANGAPVYVDYAHKPDALENVLASVRPFTTGRVIVVFGCGGDRDRGKRPIMGEIATRLADVVIVTDDNPRSEVPETIRAAILAAAPGAIEIGDRRLAIHEAVAMLHAGDTLIVAGKGHEEGQTIGSETLHFSDHEEVRAALSERAA
ncbi:MAG: UDP-N-acetylmuramoyl-L-alanyl-D-glutamate--2,6-diaminopimelate ligase [Mesorhizobium sp.]|nr:MAG: UDP-N-acetylmuramoyl-L-alanyl-D-glutamate--2,6-diaminopimelate ligase [Mesorhizobium sp.]